MRSVPRVAGILCCHSCTDRDVNGAVMVRGVWNDLEVRHFPATFSFGIYFVVERLEGDSSLTLHVLESLDDGGTPRPLRAPLALPVRDHDPAITYDVAAMLNEVTLTGPGHLVIEVWHQGGLLDERRVPVRQFEPEVL